MPDYSPEPTYQYFNQLIESKSPIVPMLSYVKVKKNGVIRKELSIIYYHPKEHALCRIFNNAFAAFMSDNLLSFERGISSQTLAGIVRPSKPGLIEQWSGDTIEKVDYEPFSLYKGLLSIIGKNDGLPLVVRQNAGIVGDIVPGIKLILDGKNTTIVRQKIKQLEALQYRIADIVSHNPIKTTPVHGNIMEVISSENFQGLSDKQMARLEKLGKL
jgi:hypothetical protein